MKKSTTRITVVIILLIVAVVGYYAYLSNKTREENTDRSMTVVENALSRNLENNYPATPKEVIKYYNEIQKCFYNEECTEEQLDQLILKVRELFDEELLGQNSLATQTIQLKQEIQDYKDNNRKITSASVVSSNNVVYDTVDGYEFAKLNCMYNIMEAGKSNPTRQVFLLRKDSKRHWKIYGWKLDMDAELAKVPGEE